MASLPLPEKRRQEHGEAETRGERPAHRQGSYERAKGQAANPAHFCCCQGPSGASLRLPVRLIKWMDEVAGEQIQPETWQTGAHRTPLWPQALQESMEADSETSQKEEEGGGQGHLGVGGEPQSQEKEPRLLGFALKVTPGDRYQCHPHWTDEETEAQRGKVAEPRGPDSHSPALPCPPLAPP